MATHIPDTEDEFFGKRRERGENYSTGSGPTHDEVNILKTSTGPKATAGKAKYSRNAIRTGVKSRLRGGRRIRANPHHING